MSQLQQSLLLENSFWSYNTSCLVGDLPEDNPIPMTDSEKELMHDFVNKGPYYCDSDNATAHNNHRYVSDHLYTHSYCHLVLETLFDADQSNGTFITEKTYKCIKFGQPFVLVGPVGSLEALRQAGYRTFDHAIDNSYDQIKDNGQRWDAVKHAIGNIKKENLHQWYLKCLPDLIHNQQLFRGQVPSLLKFIKFLTTHHNPV
jgi:hypothetical protein